MKNLIVFLVLISLSIKGRTQSEAHLEQIFEGQRVEVLIEMPASSEGIDIFADRRQRMDFDDYSQRIKKYGIALFPGDQVLITKIKKKGKHIEFQLAGGGYGTWTDDNETVSATYISKSARQEELEKVLKEDKDKKLANRKKLERELKDLERERSIKQQESERQASLESEMKKARIQDQRLQGGSRFNIRYDYRIGSAELTEANIKEALSDYVNFNPGNPANATTDSNRNNSTGMLAKGMLLEEALKILGIPASLNTSNDCGLEITTCSFQKEQQKIEAIFVEKVLVKYTLTSL